MGYLTSLRDLPHLRAMRQGVHEGSSLKLNGPVPARTFRMIIGLICAAAVIKGLDESVMGGLLRALEQEFSVSATGLSLLLMSSGLAAALSSVGWGLVADMQPRDLILMVGAAWWGVATLFVGSAPSFWMLCAGRALTGVALSAVLPISQSMVADLVPPTKLGHYFSIIAAIGCVGGFVGQVVSTSFAESWVGGVRAWRIVLWTIGVLSLLLALAVFLWGEDPCWVANSQTRSKLRQGEGCCARPSAYLRFVCRVRTFQLLVLQGVFGAVPWSALYGFGIILLQYIGFGDFFAACLMGILSGGSFLGMLLGGYLGDHAEQRSADTGRVRVAQCSVFASLLCALFLFVIIPPTTGNGAAYGVCLFCLGFFGQWCSAGVNQPLLSQLVPSHMRATIMAAEVAIEGSSASIIGGPVLGIIAQHAFGYTSSDLVVADIPLEDRATNVHALRSALTLLTVVPWSLCLISYTLVGYTYANDRDSVRSAIVVADEDDAPQKRGKLCWGC